jgi:hypothetical protein
MNTRRLLDFLIPAATLCLFVCAFPFLLALVLLDLCIGHERRIGAWAAARGLEVGSVMELSGRGFRPPGVRRKGRRFRAFLRDRGGGPGYYWADFRVVWRPGRWAAEVDWLTEPPPGEAASGSGPADPPPGGTSAPGA